MDPSSSIQLTIIVILLLLSAFFSSAETAFMTANRIKIRTLAEGGNRRAIAVSKILDNSSKMLSAILISNNIVNITASALTTALSIHLWGSVATGISTGILTFLILIVGEITPKNGAIVHADKLVLSYAGVILFVMTILTPVIFIIDNLTLFILKLLKIDPANNKKSMTEIELRTIVALSHEDGVIESEEKRIINNLFDFGDSQAKDIMIPRIDMTVASIDSTYDEIIDIFRSEKYTRIPIYENSSDNIVAIINVKDLLLFDSKEDFNIRDILREPYFTYEYKNTAQLMEELKKTSNNITIVIDEYGSTVGMITLEDLLEEIVGEIRDEYDTDEHDSIEQIGAAEYKLDGSAKLDDLNELLGFNLQSDDYDSIAGFIIEKLDELPKENDVVELPGMTFLIAEVNNNRIETVLLSLNVNDTDALTEVSE